MGKELSILFRFRFSLTQKFDPKIREQEVSATDVSATDVSATKLSPKSLFIGWAETYI